MENKETWCGKEVSKMTEMEITEMYRMIENMEVPLPRSL